MGAKEEPVNTFVVLLLVCGSLDPVSGFILKGCRTTVTTAICVANKLTQIPKDLPPTVTTIDLTLNRLSRIQPSDFPFLPVLKRLDLNQNKISQIDRGAFSGLSSLQKLNLNNNKLLELGEGVFEGLSSLTELRIASNSIKSVASTCFESATSLTFLDMSNNDLQDLAHVRLVIRQLPGLRDLVLKRNRLTSFRSWELANSSIGLSALDLSQNRLEDFRVSADIFPNLTRFNIGGFQSKRPMVWDTTSAVGFLGRVSRLDISGLPVALKDMRLLLGATNGSLDTLRMNSMRGNLEALVSISCSIPTLSTLILRSNNLRSIPVGFFRLCVNVSELDLAQNKIQFIHEEAFRSLGRLRILTLSNNKLSIVPNATRNLPFLSKLDLSSNSIGAIGCRDFGGMTRLSRLSLYQNSIPHLPDCAFVGLERLEILKLQNSHISKLNGAFRTDLPKLTRLHLNGNLLTAIKPRQFEGLRSLQNLSLHFNQIAKLSNESFFGLTELVEIQLQSNLITKTDIETGAFNVLTSLRRLDLRENRIKYKESRDLPDPPFSKLSHLRELSIPGQHYKGKTYLPPNLLEGLSNLTLFDAKSILLTSLPRDMFKYTPRLETLDLSVNELNDLSPELFSPIGHLKGLYISRITLKSLDFLVYANLNELEFLQAKKNQFAVIPEEVISSLPALVFVDLEDNGFSCECTNEFFLKWMKASPQTQVAHAYSFTCNHPAHFRNTSLLDFSLQFCLVGAGFLRYVSTSCLVLGLLAASFTYHFTRWQLVFAYHLFRARLFDRKNRNRMAPHQYDAFVSYNAHDEGWVVRKLLPKLEGEQGWRLCLHHRDFQPGKAITDNITDAIYGSRKTICVISHRYLESEWCSREVQAAGFRLFDEHKDVLILVFLEDIPSYLLSPYHRMRNLLKKKTYLSWPRAQTHPEVFWEKLRLALQSGDELDEHRLLSNRLHSI
ncbi:uncharacterized protein ACNS7B_023364 [Menidia menidia]